MAIFTNHFCQRTRPDATRRGRSGFTLVEIVAAVIVVLILAMIAVPAVRKVASRAKAGALVGHFNAIEKALWQYCEATGHYPPATGAGQDPGFFTNVHNDPRWRGPYIGKGDFIPEVSPIGGQWQWHNNESGGPPDTQPFMYGIAIVNGAQPIDHVAGESADAIFDDGNLSTGRWTKSRWTEQYLYIIKAREECVPQATPAP